MHHKTFKLEVIFQVEMKTRMSVTIIYGILQCKYSYSR